MTDSEQRAWWMTGVIGFIWFVIMGATIASTGVLLLPVTHTFDCTMQDAGFAVSAFITAMTLVGPALGGLIDRFGAHRMMNAGVILTAAGCLAAAASATIEHFTWAMALTGAGVGASTYLPGTVVIASWFEHRRGFALGVALAIAALGAGVVPPCMSWLMERIGWQSALQLVAVLLLCVVLPVVFAFVRARPQQESADGAPDDTQRSGSSVAALVRLPVVWMLIVLAFLTGLGFEALYLYIVPFLREAGYSATAAAGLFGVANVSTMPGSLLFGALADRLGTRPALLMGLVICALSIPLILLADTGAPGLTAVILFGVLWGATCNLSPQFTPLILAETVGMRHFGLILGSTQLVYGLAMAAGPLLTSTVYDITAGYGAAFLACAVLVALSLLPVAFMGSSLRKQESGYAS